MKKILIIGSGRSSTSLIEYLLQNAQTFDWQITVADLDESLAKEKVEGFNFAKTISFNTADIELRHRQIKEHDFIISMLPASMHMMIAKDCLEFGKHLATASYVGNEMKKLDAEAKEKNLFFLNECGLDPGLDNASAMQTIDKIHKDSGKISSFKSYCGGLVAPESNDNPWGYKFSWNPRNVVLAGQGTAQYLKHGEIKCIPYNRLFSQIENVEIKDSGNFDAYANRDSLSYKEIYGLHNVNTMFRGTLRQQGYCKAWNVFVQLGLTEDTTIIQNANKLTFTSLIESFLPDTKGNLKKKLKQFLGKEWDIHVENKMDYLQLFSHNKIEIENGTPAQILQSLLEEKWKLEVTDKDMIVMQHQFEFETQNKELKKLNSDLVVIGKDNKHTAMALTVGLPLAITVKNFLSGKIKLSGVQIPTSMEIYEPLLKELEEHNIVFKHYEN